MNSHSHYPYDVISDPRRYRYASGDAARPYPFNENPDYTHAWVSHYYFKSLEEFFERRTRRQADVPLDLTVDDERISDGAMARYLEVFLQRDNAAGAPKQPLVEGVAKEKERLLNLKGVTEALSRVQDLYSRRLERVRGIIYEGERYHEPSTPPFAVREILLSRS